jgi:hypothetical protein
MFSDDIRFKSLSLKNGQIYVERLKDGTLSFDILKGSGNESTGSPGLHFNKIVLTNMDLRYKDALVKQDYNLQFIDGEITGKYAEAQIALELNSEVVFSAVRIGNDSYLNGVKGTASGEITIDLNAQSYVFHELNLLFGDLHYEVNGSFRDAGDHQFVDIVLNQSEGDVSTFLALLPPEFLRSIPVKSTHGAFAAEGVIKGRISKSENPHIHFDMRLEDTHIASKRGLGELRNVRIQGSIDNGSARSLRSTILSLPSIEGKAYGQKFEAAVTLRDFSDPELQCAFEGSLPAGFVLDYAGLSDFAEEISGTMHFSDISIAPVRIERADFTDIGQIAGRCTLGNIVCKTSTTKYEIPDGLLTLSKDTLHVSDLRLSIDKDDIAVEGWIAHLGDALEGEDPAYLRYQLAIEAGTVHLTKWIPGLADQNNAEQLPQAKPASYNTSSLVRLPEGGFTIKAEELH